MKQYLNFIDGDFVATGKTFANRAPVDNRVLGMVHEAGQPEVNAAVRAAQAALDGPWGQMPVAKRVELLYAVADEINRRFDDFLAAEMADTGKPLSLASHIDIPRVAANFKIFADVIKNVPTESFEMTTPDGGTAINYALRSPLAWWPSPAPVEPAAAADDLEGRPGAGLRQHRRSRTNGSSSDTPGEATAIANCDNGCGAAMAPRWKCFSPTPLAI